MTDLFHPVNIFPSPHQIKLASPYCDALSILLVFPHTIDDRDVSLRVCASPHQIKLASPSMIELSYHPAIILREDKDISLTQPHPMVLNGHKILFHNPQARTL